MHFWQFHAELSNKSRSMKAIYICASGRSRYALSENGVVYYAMTFCFQDITIWNWRILLNSFWVRIFFDILIANFWYFNGIFFDIFISWTVVQIHKNHAIIWKSVMRFFRCIYVNCWGQQNIVKIALFWTIYGHNSRRKHGG